jgi:hypothetical protein
MRTEFLGVLDEAALHHADKDVIFVDNRFRAQATDRGSSEQFPSCHCGESRTNSAGSNLNSRMQYRLWAASS